MMGTQVGGWVSACLEEGDAAEPFDAFPGLLVNDTDRCNCLAFVNKSFRFFSISASDRYTSSGLFSC